MTEKSKPAIYGGIAATLLAAGAAANAQPVNPEEIQDGAPKDAPNVASAPQQIPVYVYQPSTYSAHPYSVRGIRGATTRPAAGSSQTRTAHPNTQRGRTREAAGSRTRDEIQALQNQVAHTWLATDPKTQEPVIIYETTQGDRFSQKAVKTDDGRWLGNGEQTPIPNPDRDVPLSRIYVTKYHGLDVIVGKDPNGMMAMFPTMAVTNPETGEQFFIRRAWLPDEREELERKAKEAAAKEAEKKAKSNGDGDNGNDGKTPAPDGGTNNQPKNDTDMIVRAKIAADNLEKTLG